MRRWGSIPSLRRRSSRKTLLTSGARLSKGRSGVRAHEEETVRTITLFVAILKRKTVTARVWVAVIGLVVYVSLHARPALSFLETVFTEAHGYAPGAVFVPGRRAC